MNAAVQRVFHDAPAVRAQVPLLIGLVGPSGSGKTKSALRLAEGIQRVIGGDIFGVDSEANRMLHYADSHRFRHVPFSAPFDALSYLAAVEHCVKKGAKTVIIDSASHLHEGPGGTLEQHEAECERLMRVWKTDSRDKVQMAAWANPKQELRKFLNTVLQMQVNTIWCFRAKEKLKIIPGKQPQALGFMPIAGDEMIYEMTLNCLLYPNSKGVPAWQSAEMGERQIIKLPEQFVELFREAKSLDETIGEGLAKWAAGGSQPAPELDALIADYAKCANLGEFKALEQRRAGVWSNPMPAGYKARIKEASDSASKRLAQPTQTAPSVASAPVADIPTWVETLNGQEAAEGLEEAWKACSAAFNGNPPNECHSAYTLRKEKLAETATEELGV